MEISKENNELLSAALHYAVDLGWPVFPSWPGKKNPLTPNGCYDAKTDPGALQFWWNKWPDANVAVATGNISGILVIDLDYKPEENKDGPAELQAWERETGYKLPETVTAVSGSGGQHLYYRYDPTKVKVGSKVNLIWGIDVRADRSCVIAPPSVHACGREYFWDISPDDMPMAEADEAVFKLLALGALEKTKKDGAQGGGGQRSERMKAPQVIPCGERNDTLFRLACKMQSDGFPDDAILAAIQQTNENSCEEPIDDKELCKLVDSALKYEKGGIFIDYGMTTTQPAAQPAQPAPGVLPEGVNQDLAPEMVFRPLKRAADLLAEDLPEPVTYVGVGEEVPLLCEGTCILSAKPKLGKSWLALAMCLAIAKGEDFLGYKTKKCSTLYLDLETGKNLQQKRLKKALAGEPCPPNFYIDGEARTLATGLIGQIEYYMQQDPDIGVIVVDVFQKIRTPLASYKETEYDHAYRDIGMLNEVANKYHISLIIVSHDRKTVDPDDEFANILGSTGLQAAVMQMMVMYRRRKDDPIHIAVKGKTIDGLPSLDVKLDGGQWTVVEGVNAADRQEAQDLQEYMQDPIRQAILAIMKKNDMWKGRCSSLVGAAAEYGIAITKPPIKVGGFLNKHIGRMLKIDKIRLQTISNGTGSKIYQFTHFDPAVEAAEKQGFIPVYDVDSMPWE